MTPLINNSPVVAVDGPMYASLIQQIGELQDANFRLRLEQRNHDAELELAWRGGRDEAIEECQRTVAELRARLASFAGDAAVK